MPPFTKRQRLLLRWGGFTALAVLVLGIAALLSRPQVEPVLQDTDKTSAGITSVLSRQATAEMAQFRFDEVREAAGIDFQHFPATRQSLLPEDMGSGLAWGDYDNDGDPDLYLVNFFGPVTQPIPEQTTTGRSALYRNEGNGSFTDVSQQAGVDRPTFGQAAAWGDYDNDGDLDLYVTNY
ncbi:MAG: VCBS repeat-containing protein, partial [Pseudomonadota bacterium]